MQLMHRLQTSHYFDNFATNWKWIFTLCCSFNDGSQSKGLQLVEEKMPVSHVEEDDGDIGVIIDNNVTRGLSVETLMSAMTIMREVTADCDSDLTEVLDRKEEGTISGIIDEGLTDDVTAVIAFNFDVANLILIIDVIDVEFPRNETAGAPQRYQLCIKVDSHADNTIKKWTSPVFEAYKFPGPVKIECTEVSPKDMSSTIARIWLCGYNQSCGNRILSECTTDLANVHLHRNETSRIRLCRTPDIKQLPINDLEMDISRCVEGKMKVIKGAHLGPLLQGPNEATLPPSSSCHLPQLAPPSTTSTRHSPLTKMQGDEHASHGTLNTCTVTAKENCGNQAELLVGLGYSSVTGRVTVEIVKGHSFKNPHAKGEEKMPNTYVKMTLLTGGRHEISKSKTAVQPNQSNPLFKEKFMFQVSESQLTDVSLTIEVYHRRSINRKEIIGSFSLGTRGTKSDRPNHWNDMKEFGGDVSFQWHPLRTDRGSKVDPRAADRHGT